MALSPSQKAAEVERFRRGCREALGLLSGPLPSDAEVREAARTLGRLHYLPEPQQTLPLEPSAR